MIKKFFRFIKRLLRKSASFTPEIIEYQEHKINKSIVSANALSVLKKLRQAGYSAYLVGGCIRDLMLNIEPKDYDIVTDALPEQVKKIFSNCILIGKRFRLAHIRFRNEIIEVATFRASGSKKILQNTAGMIVRDNVYGTIEDDVLRRDFTINALFYEPNSGQVIDYVNGVQDLRNKTINFIGEPIQRYVEDPVRMLRAVRFAVKLNFEIAKETAAPIAEYAYLLENVSSARLFEEYLKLFMYGNAHKTFIFLKEYRLMEQLFPLLSRCVNRIDDQFINIALQNTDQRVLEGKTLSPAFLLAVFLWPILQHKVQILMQAEYDRNQAFTDALSFVFDNNNIRLAIPNKIQISIKEIWFLQTRLEKNRCGKKLDLLLTHQRFRAAYDFLAIGAASGYHWAIDLYAWWEKYLAANAEEQALMTSAIQKIQTKKTRKKRNKRKSNSVSSSAVDE